MISKQQAKPAKPIPTTIAAETVDRIHYFMIYIILAGVVVWNLSCDFSNNTLMPTICLKDFK